MSFQRLSACLLLLLSLVGCAAAPIQAPPSPAAAPGAYPVPDLSQYRIGIGDRLRVEVYGEGDLSLEATVDPGGRISYPLLGSIPVVNKTAKELQDDMVARLSAGYLRNPDVRVLVTGYRAFYVIGQVRKPGSYPYVIGLTVEKALAIAGGFTALASSRRMFLLHENQPTDRRIKVELGTTVLPGDTLVIEEGLF